MHLSRVLAGLLIAVLAQAAEAATEHNPVRRQPTNHQTAPRVERIIVKFRPSAASLQAQAKATQAVQIDEVRSLAARTKLNLKQSRAIASGLHVMQVESVDGVDVLSRLRADAAVEFAEPDGWRYLHATPNDLLFPNQWYLRNEQPAAVDAVSAWDITQGSKGVVIAVIDTGVRFSHPDLRDTTSGRLLPGYDFVSADPGGAFFTANDGDGRDPSPSDPGDWVLETELERAPFACQPTNSSWHGTRVAGVIGALTNNSAGIAGLSWGPWILPVRGIGKCGGYDSDILAAMRWAAGLHVDGVPDNPFPARIVNLSIGALGPCPQSYRSVLAELEERNVLVVASAGNEGGPVGAPANCPGVVGVAGLRHAGTKVGYSSLGPEITISAPAGNCVNIDPGQPCLFSIDTTSNSGTTIPGENIYTDQFNINIGTSFSAPIVSAIAGLMLSANGNLRPRQLIARLKESATPFPVSSDPAVPMCRIPLGPFDVQPTECTCTQETCGAGMANALAAVKAALRPIAAIAVPENVSPGQEVILDASGSSATCTREIVSYSWSVVDDPANGDPEATPISGADTARAMIIAPPSGSITVRLTVTDDAGLTDSADVIVTSTSATTTAPATAGDSPCLEEISFTPPEGSGDDPLPGPGSGGGAGGGAGSGNTGGGGGGGGGGAIDWLALLAMLAAAPLLRRPVRQRLLFQ